VYDTISFLSDLGRDDEHVGIAHSVIASIAPGARIIDLTHGIRRGDIRGGGLALARSADYLCPGVVLAAVGAEDTDRDMVAISVGEGMSVLLGPDNGVLAAAVALVGGASQAVVLAAPEYRLVSPGVAHPLRDILAPAAAHLCTGVALDRLGPAIDSNSLLPGVLPVSEQTGDELRVEVLWVDTRGNVQLNAGPEDLASWAHHFQVRAGDDIRRASLVTSRAEVGAGELGLIVDPHGLLALVVDRGSAAAELRLGEASEVLLVPIEAPDAPAAPTARVELRTRTGRDQA
jgi:hypothetical protein